MISYVRGMPRFIEEGSVVVDVQGVGYKVFVSEKTLAEISKTKGEVALFCHLRLKKDETLELYGFLSQDALRLFEVLLGVQGVGPKAALLLSSLGSMEELQKAIAQGDESFFAGVKGIGTKKIQKIILELTGKFKRLEKTKGAQDESVSALIALGFSQGEAQDALSHVSADIANHKERVKQALKILGRK
ncbi:MAG: Holliday junction branch migration protein RuvA [Candidatus Wildermuthbacteria bacterium]|nr:Holliday junction branch migration protein RuvA [Candidatus Wildermuthbacteria bacterium]